MRRINNLFMLVMMMCMSVFTAQADKRYTAEGFGDASSAWGEGGIQVAYRKECLAFSRTLLPHPTTCSAAIKNPAT